MVIFTNVLNEVKKQMKVFNIFSSSLYSAIKYKLNFATFEDAVISTCNSLTHSNYIFTKVIQWGVQEIYNDANIKNNDKLKITSVRLAATFIIRQTNCSIHFQLLKE